MGMSRYSGPGRTKSSERRWRRDRSPDRRRTGRKVSLGENTDRKRSLEYDKRIRYRSPLLTDDYSPAREWKASTNSPDRRNSRSTKSVSPKEMERWKVGGQKYTSRSYRSRSTKD